MQVCFKKRCRAMRALQRSCLRCHLSAEVEGLCNAYNRKRSMQVEELAATVQRSFSLAVRCGAMRCHPSCKGCMHAMRAGRPWDH